MFFHLLSTCRDEKLEEKHFLSKNYLYSISKHFWILSGKKSEVLERKLLQLFKMAFYMSRGSFSRVFFFKKSIVSSFSKNFQWKNVAFVAQSYQKRLSKKHSIKKRLSINFGLLANCLCTFSWESLTALSKVHSVCTAEQLVEKEFFLWRLSCNFFQNSSESFSDFVKKIGHWSHNSIPNVHGKISKRTSPDRKDVFDIALSRWQNILWTLGTEVQNIFATAFFVSVRTIWGKKLRRKHLSMFVFRRGLNTIPNLGENFSARSSNLHFTYQKKQLEERCFLSKNWFLYTFHKKLRTLSKKNSDFGKNLPARLSKLHFASSEENLKISRFF